jgi:hypothetical protein
MYDNIVKKISIEMPKKFVMTIKILKGCHSELVSESK